MTRHHSRRAVLGSVAGAIALAGCSELTPGGASVGFRRVEVEGEDLVVELDSADSTVAISVIDPRGETYAETEIGVGATRETIHLGTTYLPGEYEVRAILEGETAAKTTTEIQPELEIIEIGIGANYPERMPDALGHTYSVESFLSIRNIGTGPTSIRKLVFSGDVPAPSKLGENESGIFDVESGAGQISEVAISPGQDVTIFSSTLPFSFEGSGVDCRESSWTGTFSVLLESTNIRTTKRSYQVWYPASEEYNGCNPRIEGEG